MALVADVMARRGKHLQAVRALKMGLDKSPSHPAMVVALVKYAARLKNKKFTNVNPTVMNVVKQEVCAMMRCDNLTSLPDFVESYLEQSKTSRSLSELLGAFKCLQITDKSNVAKISEAVAGIDLANSRHADFKNIVELLKVSTFHELFIL